MKRFLLNFWNGAILGLVMLNIFAFLFLWSGRNRGELLVHVLDVGQGDAIFIETPSHRQIFIDGGPSRAVVHRLGSHMPWFDHNIDMAILTHTDNDHIIGHVEALDTYRAGVLLDTGSACDKSVCQKYQQQIEDSVRSNSIHLHALLGQRFDFGDGAQLTILHPFRSIAGEQFSQPNETSIVAKLEYQGRSFLFTGDIGEQTEEKLNLAGLYLDVDVLKVAHHGSKHSSTDGFLHALTPDSALISVGAKNPYGHPTKEALDRLAQAGAAVFRTDQSGDITVHVNRERELWIEKAAD